MKKKYYRMSLVIDKDVLKQLKYKAVSEEKSVTALVRTIIDEYLKKSE